ncbi:MAG: TetR/AcrR family transcriptional regulator [Clostridia bacterium]|jgi:AcrR family transcriptional regulator|nr:TetR/AcrR family transcriptional regulator [Clostridia bacterium]
MKMEEHLTSRQVKAQQTKQNLFKSALALFAEKDYNHVSVDEIVAKAGTSKGAFYTHFRSKDQVIIEQFQQVDEHYLNIIKKLKECNSAREKLSAFVLEHQAFTKNELGLDILKVVYNSQLNHAGDKIINDERRPLYTIIQEIIQEGQNSGEFRSDISAMELTRFIVRCMRGAFFDWCLADGSYSLEEDGQKFFSLVISGLQKPDVTCKNL